VSSKRADLFWLSMGVRCDRAVIGVATGWGAAVGWGAQTRAQVCKYMPYRCRDVVMDLVVIVGCGL